MRKSCGRIGLIAIFLVLLFGTAGAQVDPGRDPWGRYPEIKQLRRELKQPIKEMENTLDQEDGRGRDTSCAQQAMAELRWRLRRTGDVKAARDRFAVARFALMLQTNLEHPPSARDQATDGSYGACTTEFFLKVDYSAEQASQWEGKPPAFLKPINTPGSLTQYLASIRISDIPEQGVDHRTELNLAGTSLIGLVWRGTLDGDCWRGKPTKYCYHPGLQSALRVFISHWQDPETGFFGPWYREGGSIVKKTDLSITFHVASYARCPSLQTTPPATNCETPVRYWPQMIERLLKIKNKEYPNGWLERDKNDNLVKAHHHNYDVVRLFRLGWQSKALGNDLQQRARVEIEELLKWCTSADVIDPKTGEILNGKSEATEVEDYYFLVAFLDEVGYFTGVTQNPKDPFWVGDGRTFPGAPTLRALLRRRVEALDQRNPYWRGTMDMLQ